MALPWDPATDAYVPNSAALANPVQSPLQSPQDQATIEAMGKRREKQALLERMRMMAQVLRDEQLNAQGAGPFGSRQGVGPAGWATTVGDVVAGVIAEKRRKKAAEEEAKAQAQVAPATQEYAKNFYQGAPGGLYGAGAGSSYVPQGSPLSLGWDSLGSWKY